ncbi:MULTISPECIES: nitrous oxide reductase accessory protein NosL [unclassified Paenibacillus]|uniref:nitrous oxide reductase accessory protein NosL n=1 Tax=unclassified Paenibacillus TaxID=185978 RepID=UPI0019166A0F|nr:nitrous oxide reductase accessory protein NosL [Paenibacillus sp. EPM92]
MKKQAWSVLAVLFVIAMLSGCGQAKYQAIPIDEETDKCEICNMQVKDDAFAVQLTTKEGKTFKFDDLGCMNEWKRKNGTANIGAQFVRDYNNKEWIPYEDASYVYDPSFKSPMAYGIYAFKDKAEAQKFIDGQKKGKLMSAAGLGTHSWERGKGSMDMGGNHDKNAHSESGGSMGAGDKGMHGK